jgi:hypothetical protein
MPAALQGADVGAKEPGMFDPSHPTGPAAASAHAGARPLTVAELSVVLEELDRVVAELEESLAEIALPLDDASRVAARDAIAAARRH